MAYRILHALKRFAVQAAVRGLPVSKFDPAAPSPRIRSFEGAVSSVQLDDFLFDPLVSSVKSTADLLGGELSRVSGKMGELRQLLADLARIEPLGAVEVNAVAAQNFRWSEDILFDGDAFDVPARPVLALEAEDGCLFDESEAPLPSWQVLRESEVSGFQHA